MSDSFQDDAPQAAKRRLTDACRTKDTSVRLAWAITVSEAVLLGIAAVALVDYWLMLPVWMRTLAAASMGLLCLLGLYRLIKFMRRPTQLKEAALDVEAARPELGCQISTAAEYLSGQRQITRQYEPELVAALEAKAAQELSHAQMPYERRLLRPALILGVTVLGLVALALAIPGSFTALTRTALPFSKARYTQLEVKPGNIELPVGHDLEITNLFTGRAPKEPMLQWLQGGETAWHTAPLTTRSSDGAYLYDFKNLRADFKYQVTGNDAASAIFEVKTYTPPEVKDLNLQIQYPSYTQLPATTQKSPDISVVRASTVQIQIDPTVRLAKAKLRFSAGAEELSLQPTPEGAWAGSFKVTKDTDYWIELADDRGHRGGGDKPHHIKAIPDAPPKVEVQDPGQDMRAASTNKVPIKISVADDFGVDEIQVAFHKLGGAEQIVPAKRETNEKGEVTATAELDLATLDLREYELVAYHAQAKDNNSLDGPGMGQSPVYFVEITNLEGGACKKKTPGQKVNLLDIQKQIIADTAALATNAPSEKFSELATRQTDAVDFGKIYQQTLSTIGAPAPALEELQSALSQMTSASGYLADHKRGDALPPEEGALAHLYQVLKQLPELQDLPTQPKPQTQPPPSAKLAVVLDALKQKKKEPAEPQALQDALRQAQDLVRSQAGVNTALRKAAQAPSECQSPGEGQGKGQGQSNSAKSPEGQPKPKGQGQEPAPGQPKDTQLAKAESKDGQGQKPGQAKGKGKGQGQGKGQGKGKGQGQGEGEGQNPPDQADQPPAEQQPPQDTPEMAQQEQQLSKEAAALAEKLQRLAGKDKRVGRNAGQNAHLAGQKIASAADEIKQGKFGAAGVNGFQGELALREVVSQLERIVQKQPELTDVANEEAPKQYETLISEYFKKLSHAE